MKKLFTKFLLLTVFFLSGYSQLYAHATRHSIANKTVNNLHKAAINTFDTFAENDIFVVKSALPHTEKGNYEFEVTDQEDEISSFKKIFTNSIFFTDTVAIHSNGYFFNFLKISSLHKDFSYLSSKRYILFRVIRI